MFQAMFGAVSRAVLEREPNPFAPELSLRTAQSLDLIADLPAHPGGFSEPRSG